MHKNDKSCYQLIWPFYGLVQPYEQKFQKSPISVSSVHKYHKSCTQLNWPFYGFLQTKWEKSSKISYLRMLSTQVSRIVFLTHLTVLLFLQLYEEKLQKSH